MVSHDSLSPWSSHCSGPSVAFHRAPNSAPIPNGIPNVFCFISHNSSSSSCHRHTAFTHCSCCLGLYPLPTFLWVELLSFKAKCNATSSRKPLLISPIRIIFLLPSGLDLERYRSLIWKGTLSTNVFICKRARVSSGQETAIPNGVPA